MFKTQILNRQPLFILVICFITGIFFQDLFSFDLKIIHAVVGVSFALIILTFFNTYFISKCKPVFLAVSFIGIGIGLHFLNSIREQNFKVGKNETVVFKISKKLNSTEKNKKYEAVVSLDHHVFNAVVLIPKNSEELDFKHYYKAPSYISEPQSPEHDFQFHYSKYLHRKNINYQCYINGEISSAPRNDLSLNENVLQKRLEVLQNINRSKLSAKTQEFLKGIILADRTEIDSGTLQDFNRSGLVHFLAISGTHIVVIFGLLYYFLVRIIPLKFRKSAVVISLGCIWLFALCIGFGNSVVRSCIMLSVYFGYILLQRKPDLLHSMALSAFIILIIDTQQVFDVGFQLSFLAVLGIFWLNQPILSYLPKQDNYFKKLIYNTVSVSVSAQLATLPLVLYYFHQFSFISIIANFFIVPFSEVIIVFSFIMTGLFALGLDFSWMIIVYDEIVKILLHVIHWFADFDQFFFEHIPMNLAEVSMLFLVLYFLRCMMVKNNFKNRSHLLMTIIGFCIVRISFTVLENQQSEILTHQYRNHKIVSVKKGGKACFWIESKEDQEMIKKYIIDPYQSSRRVKNVDVKILPTNAGSVVFDGKIYPLK